ncbi:MAG TPA: glycosyltransferase family 1 protein [Rhizomicrobium sp.]|nr:glycosyltransferase family 1 protein [Rhizomicrobium sp.]
MNKRGVVFNGKFLTSGLTGVHRVAEELIKHLDTLLEENPGLRDREWTMLAPENAKRTLALRHITIRKQGMLRWQFWEQFELPWLVRGRLLVNLCNLAPLTCRGTITMIHDAQTFISPKSYSFLFQTWYQFALPRIGKAAARILTVSNYSREQLIRFGVAAAGKIQVLHNGIDHLGFAAGQAAALPAGLAPHSYALALSNTQEHKNIAILFKAFARPELAEFKLVLVGAGTHDDFKSKGIVAPDNVVFAGRVSDAELSALYKDAICFAFPSTTEGFGLPPLEAMYLGCPAVVAPCGALPEVCGDAAIYVAADDAPGWAKAILDLRMPAARAALVEKGLRHASQFTWAKCARKLLDIILEVADRQK